MTPGTPAARGFILLQRLLPQHTLSRLIHALARVRWRGLKNALISAFVRGFRPDMSDARQPDPLAYESFNAFFTRELAAGARPPPQDRQAVASPVDGTISQIGYLEDQAILQAKGRTFSLGALLGGGNTAEIAQFAGGAFATLYLAPYNYHRIHMPRPGRLRMTRHVPGRLFSVNAVTAAGVAGLFARNERVVCIWDDGQQPFSMVLVGALFVGSISTVWHGEITPPTRRRVRELAPVPGADAPLERGALMGWFNMGSTVILLFPKGRVQWQAGLAAGMTVRVGQPLGRLHDPQLPPP